MQGFFSLSSTIPFDWTDFVFRRGTEPVKMEGAVPDSVARWSPVVSFRAVAFLALWTFLIGPVLAGPVGSRPTTVTAAPKAAR
jgi:hypothetical protein